MEDCCCDVEAVHNLNKEVYPKILEIVKQNYFKFYKVNMSIFYVANYFNMFPCLFRNIFVFLYYVSVLGQPGTIMSILA